MAIIIGIDPHKSSHTAAAIGPNAELVAQIRVRADRNTHDRLLRFAAQWPERTWAVEGAKGLGHLVAQDLVTAGETVVDVPATLAARARLLQTGHGRKTDTIDAVSVATVALHRHDLCRVEPEQHTQLLRLLSDRRDELTQERRRTVNRLHRLLRELIPGGVPRELEAADAARALAKTKATNAIDEERRTQSRQLITDLKRVDNALAENRKRCAQAVKASKTTLTDIYGISDVLAAKILGHTGNIERFATCDHFASYCGAAPIEASSGDNKRHRLSRAGNRALNNALHLAARVQTLHPTPGRAYYDKKIREGKTPAEALRALKRQLVKIIWRHLTHTTPALA
jgi:transposase